MHVLTRPETDSAFGKAFMQEFGPEAHTNKQDDVNNCCKSLAAVCKVSEEYSRVAGVCLFEGAIKMPYSSDSYDLCGVAVHCKR